VDVNVVNVLFNVKDKKGALIPHLNKDQFEVFEDGQKQTIKYFTAESNLPLTLGLLLDTSGSMDAALAQAQTVGTGFLQRVLREKDLAFLINFDVNVELLTDFTASTSELNRGLKSAKINNGGAVGGLPGLGGGPIPISNPKGTLLYDAVYVASREKLANEVGRKALVLVTDGMDQGSKMKLRDAIEAAQKADTICYVLLVASGPGYRGDGEMKKLAEETGGRMIDVGRANNLRDAFDDIADELRSQYSIGYSPTNPAKDGTYRKLEIKTPAGKVQARKGYYAVKQ
jgi:VWFA-related protein